ncbi:Nipsnap [Biomphalaria glabrata]|uniref:Protein NipSnap isoform X1 n=1 Tax=Biomphalaria pfeifferi TaxID=112525 RepID=A0AAD8B497_BIOPF|nr:protein NipSnap isoform X1 [Biomphalaria glabrata]KAI8740054.1 protein NipSnap isoform X1 [Biomphalaria glabrata]KAK0047731.1 protein NipSnap isoform X1 [Biomphalaria pfeifferi]
MAALCRSVRAFNINNAFAALNKPASLITRCRGLQTSSASLRAHDSDDEDRGKGWFSRLRKTAQPEQSHSMALSSKETVYEIQFHAVKPEYMEEYINQFSTFQQLMKEKDTGAELVGSFTVEIGDQDEAVHLWSYSGGYPVLNKANTIYRTDADFLEFRKKRNMMLRSRRNQILLAFSFWPPIQPREPSHIYELRTYTLKPGTMYEWGNCWIKGLQYRKTDRNEPVAGLFSQIGEQYTVHHIWAYKDLQTRKETREAAWNRPGWDECVSYTVPLIRHMKSRILIPTPFSPLQ